MSFAKDCKSTVIPGLRYRDAVAAIEWLCTAFGFEKRAVYPNPDGTIGHAELTFGNGMVMLGSVPKDTQANTLMRQPDETGGAVTQASSLIVSDADAVYAKAKAAGAEMVADIADMPYGGRAFTCRDPEGHVWNVGSYNPWA
ncbi:MAG TPA: VOC family protein [Bryobacteraceae bacterium]|nr:VOC family protein [Bryobacteraceae bacterium]